jgi:hypothetical protein
MTTQSPLAQLDRPALPAPFTGPLAGFRFLECVARTADGETWTARADDGRDRVVQFFFGINGGGDKEGERLSLLRALRHEALEPMECVGGENKLALITGACTTTLASRFRECQAAGLPGVPRPELLARLNEAAEALDDLSEEYGVRHLGLTPSRLILESGRLQLSHFGVAELIQFPAGRRPVALNQRYSAPELLEGSVHSSSDSYSLALIYCELLTGIHPFRNFGPRQMASPRRGQPDLGIVPTSDRAVLRRALHTDPNRRFAACTDFMAALAAEGACWSALAPSATMSPVSGALAAPVFPTPMRLRMRQLINALVVGQAGDLEVREYRNARYLLRPGCSLEHLFFARMAPGTAKVKIEGFRLQWHAELVEINERQAVLLVPLSGNFWRRLMGERPGLQIRIDLPLAPAAAAISEVRVLMRPVECGRKTAVKLMEETAPELLESLRAFFQAQPERRSEARLPFDQTVQVLPVSDHGLEGDAIIARAKDISMRGLRIIMAGQPPSQQVHIRLRSGGPSTYPACLPASVVRAIPCDEGYEVGLRFLVEEGPQKE